MLEIREPIRFIGIDPFLDGAVRNWTPSDRDEESLIKFLSAVPPAVYLTGNFMSRHNLRPGDTLTVLTAGFEKKLQVLGTLPSSAEIGQGDNLAVLDISAAQDVFGRAGHLDRIDIVLSGDSPEFGKDIARGPETD